MTRHSGSILALALLAVAAMTGPSAAEDPTPPVTPPAISPPQVIVPPDQCGGDLKITQATPLQFGVISVQHGAGGVVIVSPSGAVATLGGVAVGPNAGPATIRVCGAADEEFQMLVEPTQLELPTDAAGARPNLVHDLEATVSGAELHPTGDGQWQGTLGPRGTAEIRIGGSLTIPAGQGKGNFGAPFRIRIDQLK